MNDDKGAGPLDYLRQLQSEANAGFHYGLGTWVDDASAAAKALTAYDALTMDRP